MTTLINKQIIVCADDYSQNKSISEGIVLLAEQRRINAVSCMANLESWTEFNTALHPLQPTTFIGLHLNFTHGEPLSADWKKHYGMQFSNLPVLLKNAYLKRLSVDVMTAEINAQMHAFTRSMNAYPDFIDGHQHVHQLPIIRAALGHCLNSNHCHPPEGGEPSLIQYEGSTERGSPPSRGRQIIIRKTSNGWSDLLSTDGFPKRQIIALLGGIAFQKRLTQQSIPCNTSFSGIYNFKHAANYRKYFKQFLAHSQDGGLIMCHPGNLSDDLSDPLHHYRHQELNYFMSDDYLSDLSAQSFQLRVKHGH